MTHRLDNYSRNLVIGWSQFMTPREIVDAWPWPRKPTLRDVQAIINARLLAGGTPAGTVEPEGTAGTASGSTIRREGEL